jgi:hypothetical protein
MLWVHKSPYIVRVVKSWRLQWAGRKTRKAFTILDRYRLFFFNGSSSPLRAQASYSVPWSFFPQTVGHLGRVISPSQGRYLNIGQHKHRINAYTHQTSVPWVGFETTIPTPERAKTVHALDRAATVTYSWGTSPSKTTNEREDIIATRMKLIQDGVQWRGLLLSVLNLRILIPELNI